MKRRVDTKAEEIEEAYGRKITNRQKTFSRHYVDGLHSNAECARMAGYSQKYARIQAYKLLSPTYFPHVAEFITELREERERKYGVTLMGQLKRLRELSLGAEDQGQFSAAINAEKTRSALGGHFHAIESMGREEIESRLLELRKNHPSAFVDADFEVIDGNAETGSESVEEVEGEAAPALEHHTD
jgi:hypothetical protein